MLRRVANSDSYIQTTNGRAGIRVRHAEAGGAQPLLAERHQGQRGLGHVAGAGGHAGHVAPGRGHRVQHPHDAGYVVCVMHVARGN